MTKPKYFITQSLLAAWLYLDRAGEKFDEAYEDFILSLERKPTTVSTAMRRGTAFEETICDCLNADEAECQEYDPDVRKIAQIVRGGAYQATATRIVEAGGVSFVIYAKCDWLKAGTIYDVKRVGQYDVGKYANSPQHSMYLSAIPGAKAFEYLISDGKEVYTEKYTRENTPGIETYLSPFVTYLLETGLWETYAAHWRE